jgi:rare lipoprotein A
VRPGRDDIAPSTPGRGPARWKQIGRLLTCAIGLLAMGACAAPLTTSARRPAHDSLGRGTPTALQAGADYVANGLASWYGEPYQGKPTASGEPFNPHALTAAHLALPLQSCVAVTRRENHKTVIVRINDRGPFVPGRIIDLSEAAAVAIGMLEEGVAWVHLQSIARADAEGACPEGADSPGSSINPDESGTAR